MKNKRKAETSIKNPQEKMRKTFKVHETKVFDSFTRIEIESDGNCLFRAIQYYLTESQEDHELIRKDVCDFMLKNEKFYSSLFQSDENIRTFSQYLTNMREDGVWGDHLELHAAANIYSFNIIIFNSESLNIHSQHTFNQNFRTLHLEYYNSNHYNVFIPKITAKLLINLGKRKQSQRKIGKNNDFVDFSQEQNEKGNYKINDVEINMNNEELGIRKFNGNTQKTSKDALEKDLITVPLAKISKSRKISEKRPFSNLYPYAKKGHDTYNEAYNFFNYKRRPERITEDDSFKNWKAEITKRYILQNKSLNNFSASRLLIKMKDGNLKTIPFRDEIPKLIDEAHNGYQYEVVNHNGIKATIRNLMGPRISVYWANMTHYVTEYVTSCLECIGSKPTKKIKVNKIILPKGPFDRFTADLWQIDNEMISNSQTNYKYVLS